jgi:hypothetical protein
MLIVGEKEGEWHGKGHYQTPSNYPPPFLPLGKGQSGRLEKGEKIDLLKSPY